MNPKQFASLVFLVAALALVGCNGAAAPAAPAAPETATPAQPTAAPVIAATDTPQPVPTDTVAATSEPTIAPTTAPEPTVEPTPTTEPSPTEEPPAEMSATEKLAAAFPATPTAAGEVIILTGRVLDTNSDPLPGAVVEIWQTDASGIYDHPGDSGTANRDRGFQFYGTAIAGDDGTYVFRTARPGYYEPRPKHVHVKVRLDGRELLTTQFYFDEDRADLSNEGLFAQAGSLGEMLILKAADSVTMDGAPVAALTNDLVLDTGSGGTLTATPAQGEGPYYPVVVVADFDNDLATVP